MRLRTFVTLGAIALLSTPVRPGPAGPAADAGAGAAADLHVPQRGQPDPRRRRRPRQERHAAQGPEADDFELLEDGKPQEIVTFAFEEIAAKAGALDDGVDARRPRAPRRAPCRSPSVAPNPPLQRPRRRRPRTRRAAGRRGQRPADVRRGRRPSPVDAALRHELDAAGRRAEGGRRRDQVGRTRR